MEYASCDLILACFGQNSCGHSPTGMPLCNRFNHTSSALEASTEPNSSLKAESHTIEVGFSLCKKLSWPSIFFLIFKVSMTIHGSELC